jgi:ribosome-associated translation inhibitor RaiA
VRIRIYESDLEDAVRSFLDQALYSSFQRFYREREKLRVTLQDINGPRGGVDKSCRIEVRLFPSGRWVMQEVRNANVFAAINLAIRRVKYSMRKSVERARAGRARRETIRESFPSEQGEPLGARPR